MSNEEVKQFIYGERLPVSALNLPDESEVILNPGKMIEIPAAFVDSPNVQTLIENGHFRPVREADISQDQDFLDTDTRHG